MSKNSYPCRKCQGGLKVYIAYFHGNKLDESLIFAANSEADLDTKIVQHVNQLPLRGRIKKVETAINVLCNVYSLCFEGYEERELDLPPSKAKRAIKKRSPILQAAVDCGISYLKVYQQKRGTKLYGARFDDASLRALRKKLKGYTVEIIRPSYGLRSLLVRGA